MANVDGEGAILFNRQTFLPLVFCDGERTRIDGFVNAGDQNLFGNAHGVEFKGSVVEIELEAGDNVEIRILFGIGIVLFTLGVLFEGITI